MIGDETVNLNLGVHEQTAEIKCVLTLFREKSKKRKSYKETIRMDFRNIPYYEAIKDMSKWYETIGKYEALKVYDCMGNIVRDESVEYDKLLSYCSPV